MFVGPAGLRQKGGWLDPMMQPMQVFALKGPKLGTAKEQRGTG